MKKRILASLMSLCLLVGLLPTVAFAAEDPSAGKDEQPAVCTCEAPCTEESRDETCPVCVEDYTLCEAQAEPTTTEPENDPDAQPGGEDVSDPADPACAELAGCVDGSHDPECPLYVAPVEPDTEPEEAPAPVEPTEGNAILAPAPVVEDGMSGNCGAEGNESSVTWALTKNEDGEDTYTLTISGEGAMQDFSGNGDRGWNSYADNITKIEVSEGVTYIGSRAFQALNSCETISLPASLTELDDMAFGGIYGLAEIIVAEGSQNYKVEDGVLFTADGTVLVKYPAAKEGTSYTIPAGTLELGTHAFSGIKNLTSLTLNDGLQKIGAYALRGWCENTISTLTIPDSVTELGGNALAGSVSLTSVTVGTGVTSIAEGAFSDCTNLNSITLKGAVTSIEKNAFSQCTSLKSIELPNSIETIGVNAFKGCGLTTVRIPKSVKNIESTAFYGGYTQSNVTYPDNLVAVDATAANLSSVANGAFQGMADKSIIYVSSAEQATLFDVSSSSRPYTTASTAIAITNGGLFTDSAAFVAETLSIPIKDGSIFEGWYKEAELMTKVTDNKIAYNDPDAVAPSYPRYYAKWIELKADKISVQYGNTSSDFPTIEGVTLSDWQSSDTSIVSIEDGQLKANKVGNTTITATATTTAGGSATLTVEVGVTPMPITFGNASGENPSGTIDHVYDGMAPDYFDYAAFYPAEVKDGKVSIVEDSQKIELTAGTDVVFVYDDGAGDGEKEHDSLPVNVTTTEGMSVTVKMLNPNYRFVTNTNTTPSETVSVTVKIHADNMEKQDLYINGEKVDVITGATVKVYNGEGQAPISDLTSVQAEGIETFTVHFHPLNSDTDFEEAHLESKPASELTSEAVLAIAPKEPGQYLMIVNGIKEATSPEKGSYAYASVVFSIEKATVTIKPNNITAYVGGEVPSLTDIGYTVTGLVGDDELTNAPTLSYESAPDMSTTGTYTIKASGAAANDELYKLVYEDGTLTVSRRSSGGSSSSHSVSVDSDKNGTVSVNKNNASKGSTVTITVKPDSGYELGDLIVTDKDGNEIKLTDKGNGKYTFQMPNSKVEIEASFVPQADPDIGLPFVDVPSGSWYEDAVWYVYENGLMAGTSDTTFAPDITTSRSMIVTILYRLEGTPAVSGASGFTDVADGQYYTDAVAWAAANNIVGGYGNGLFGPDDTITREQMAAILYRYAQYKDYDVTASADLSGYSDAAQVNSYALAALQWANAEGLVNGTSDTTLTPGGSATRAQVAVILMRFCENIAG